MSCLQVMTGPERPREETRAGGGRRCWRWWVLGGAGFLRRSFCSVWPFQRCWENRGWPRCSGRTVAVAGQPVDSWRGPHMWGLPHPPGMGAHGCPLLPQVSEGCRMAPILITFLISGRGLNRLGLSLSRSKDPSFYQVKVGGLTLSLLESHTTLVTVRSIFVHPSYLWEDTSSGDIALVQLGTLLKPSQFTPVCLPEAQAPLTPGTVCWVTGWGSTQERGEEMRPHPVPTLVHGRAWLGGDALPNCVVCLDQGAHSGQIWGTPPSVQGSAFCRNG